jgi:hypothetical protein
MTEATKTKPYHQRVTARFGFYDDVKMHMWREWPEGTVVTDPADIAILEALGAPVRIETLENGDSK